MDNRIIYIKLKSECDIEEHVKDSYSKSKQFGENPCRFYNLNGDSQKRITDDMEVGEEAYVVVLVHKENKILQAYLGTGILTKNEKMQNYSLKYSIKAHLDEATSAQNICKLSELKLDTDFHVNEYVLVEKSEIISDQINFIINEPYHVPPREMKYEKLDSENGLHRLAQRNEYCRRQHNLRQPMKNRGEFQRDYERITHSKAFRRMVDKAQIFSASKGDYYRTRMTHSQAVAQIAKGIAEGLRLNPYLTEAIALGHDIGHTPFGHQGERTLDDILRGKIGIIKNIPDDSFGGFKHNYQSVRIAAMLEEEYFEIYGMDLSYQTLEGMLKHTSLKRDQFLLEEFIEDERAKENLQMEQDFCSTLEGQVVAVADEIAQRGHDLDDALSSGAMSFEEFQKFLKIRKMEKLTKIVEKVDSDICLMREKQHRFMDEREVRNSRTVSAIISYFINDIIDHSAQLMEDYDSSEFHDTHRVTKQLIDLSDDARTINQCLETIIANKVINSSEVSLFDSNASTIVGSLFKAYYHNPRLLHKGTLRKIYIDMRKISENVIDFEYGNHKIIKDELQMITQGYSESVEEKRAKESEAKEGEVKESEAKESETKENKVKEYKAKQRVLVRNICDYISGMTDTYAMNEYNRIAKQL